MFTKKSIFLYLNSQSTGETSSNNAESPLEIEILLIDAAPAMENWNKRCRKRRGGKENNYHAENKG